MVRPAVDRQAGRSLTTKSWRHAISAPVATEVRGLAALQDDYDAGCEALGFLVTDGVGEAVVAQAGVEGVGAAVCGSSCRNQGLLTLPDL